MMNKKFLVSVLTTFILFALVENAKADTTGYCGANCTYTLTPKVDENGNPVYITETYQVWNSSTRKYETRERQIQAQTLNISGTGSITYTGWNTGTNRNSITHINIDEGITAIGETRTVTFSNGRTYNQDVGNIFSNMKNLENVNLPNTLTTIHEASFAWNPKLTSITIPEGVTSIGTSTFNGSGLTEINLPNSLTSIGNYAFYNTKQLESIDIPDSVTSIGQGAFNGSGLTEVALSDSLNTIGSFAFQNTKLTDVTIPDSVVSIGTNAFAIPTLQNMIIEGDYTSLSSATAGWNAQWYGVDEDAVISNILGTYTSSVSGIQNIYCTKDMQETCQELLNVAARMSGTSPELFIFEKSGNYYKIGQNRYASLEDMKNGIIKEVKRIYTVDEAVKAVSPKGNTFILRYR